MTAMRAPREPLLDMPASAMLFETADLDHAREQIGRVYCPCRFSAGVRRPTPARMHNLPGLAVGVSRFAYGADIVVEPERFGDFVLVLSTLAGRAAIAAEGCRHDGGPGRTVLVSHRQPARFHYSADNVQLVARIPVARLAEVGASLAASPAAVPASQVLDGAQHARWLALLGGLQQLLHPDTPAPLRSLLLPRAEELLLTSLLWNPVRPGGPPAPASLRRALDFMHAHAGEALTLAAIARAAQCGARTLHRVFQQSRGRTPMQELRQIRLARVRQALLHDAAPASVTATALRWGFTHLGQFAQDYRRAFGEKPSDTLRRRA